MSHPNRQTDGVAGFGYLFLVFGIGIFFSHETDCVIQSDAKTPAFAEPPIPADFKAENEISDGEADYFVFIDVIERMVGMINVVNYETCGDSYE